MNIINLNNKIRLNQFDANAPGVAVPVVESSTTYSEAHANTPSNSLTFTITKPTGVVSGDLLLTIVSTDLADNDSDFMASGDQPAGWTILSQSPFATAPDCRVAILYKVAGGSEPADYTFDINNDPVAAGGWGIAATCIRVSGVDTVSPIDQIGTWATFRHDITGVTTSEVNTLAFYCVGGDGADTGPYAQPTGWTELVDIQSDALDGGVGTSLAVGYKGMPTAGATGTATATNSANDGFSGVQFNIKGA